MNLKYIYWFFKNAVPKRICDDIVNTGLLRQKSLGTVGDIPRVKKLSKKDKKNILKTRNSSIVWLNEQWIYDEIMPYMHMANKNAGWNFDLDWSESCQFTIYKKNQFYDWHCDSWHEPYPNTSFENFRGKIRKISLTLQLSDPEDYKGGEFMFNASTIKQKNNIIYPKDILSKGTIIVFPSHIFHKVSPVTKGTRYSLVNWSLGKPFK